MGERRGISFTLVAHAPRDDTQKAGFGRPVDPRTGSRRHRAGGGLRRHAHSYFLCRITGIGAVRWCERRPHLSGNLPGASGRVAGLLDRRTRPLKLLRDLQGPAAIVAGQRAPGLQPARLEPGANLKFRPPRTLTSNREDRIRLVGWSMTRES